MMKRRSQIKKDVAFRKSRFREGGGREREKRKSVYLVICIFLKTKCACVCGFHWAPCM